MVYRVSFAATFLSRSLGFAAVLGLAAIVLLHPVYAQVGTCSLSGTVRDSSGGVILNAKIELKDEATNAVRSTVSNGAGYFSFVSLLPSSYTVTVSSTGFATWEQRNVVLHSAESRTLPNIALKVAGSSTEVQVVSTEAAVAPINTGEARTTLNEKMVSQMMIQGRDAAELMKIMPGMAMTTGLGQTQWSSLTTQSNSGPVGQYSANGTQPYGGLQLTVDGGVIVDTGNMGTQTANINQDQTSELTVRNSAFDAEYAHGPVVVNATSKSGTSALHGEAYTYTRNGSLNAANSYFNANGIAKPIDHYWYPGFDIGGPVVIPGTNFNKNHDKLFFYGGFEYMMQHPVGNLDNYFVPTPNMLNGNFSQSELAPFSKFGWSSATVPCAPGNNGQWWYGNFCGKSAGSVITNGQIPTSLFDPNGLAYMKTMPKPNVDPTTHGGYNYQFLDQSPVDRWEMKLRADYNVTENTRLYVSYNRQNETDYNRIGVWWWPAGALPYPSSFPANQISDLWSASATHTFGPSLTNETTFNYTSFINPLTFSNPSAVSPASVGMNIKLPYNSGTTPMIPNTVSWNCSGNSCMPIYWAPAFSNGFQNGAFGALKRVPSIADNLAWVKGSHLLKFGFYWDRWGNQQTEGTWDANNGFPQGRYEFDNWAWGTTGNPMADMLLGHAAGFAQTSADPTHTLWFTEVAFYAQDQWKATRRLTLDVGVRFDHEGQWFPASGEPGMMVWDPSSCTGSTTGPGCVGSSLPGFLWNGRDSSIPRSGYESAAIVPDPRVGAAYDLFGNGRTVLRGGFGVYRYQFAYNSVTGGILDGPMGIQAFSSNCNIMSWSQIGTDPACQPTVKSGALPASNAGLAETALVQGDNKTPYTQNWNIMIDQRGPWHSLIEIGYTGSRSRNELLGGNGGNLVNKVPLGAYFKPDPVTGTLYCLPPAITTGCTAGGIPGSAAPDYRPYNYGTIQVNSHGSYANYNAMQLSWQKQAGRATFVLNYTWSKTMGIRDGETDNGSGNGAAVDRFNILNNYGVLGYDRTHIFNAAYVFRLPDPVRGSSAALRMAKAVVNGWEVSGITQYQSGSPIQPNSGGTLNMATPSAYNNQTILGTPDQILMPLLTCDPRSGLSSGQYFNPSCFALPTTPGQNGPFVWPDIRGPAYISSDLGLYKNFRIRERQSIQFRLQAFNFLNHPLPDFTLQNSDLTLSFVKPDGSPSASNTNSNLTGSPLYTTGRRVVELSLKWMF